MEKCLEKGLTIICWSSTQVDNFISGVTRACTDLEVFVNHINDENEHRIERVLQEMTMLNLCYIPSLDPCTVDEFLSKTEVSLFQIVD